MGTNIPHAGHRSEKKEKNSTLDTLVKNSKEDFTGVTVVEERGFGIELSSTPSPAKTAGD